MRVLLLLASLVNISSAKWMSLGVYGILTSSTRGKPVRGTDSTPKTPLIAVSGMVTGDKVCRPVSVHLSGRLTYHFSFKQAYS